MGVKIWENRKYWYTREENLEFGCTLEARFTEPPSDDEFEDAVAMLYEKIRKVIKAEVKLETSKNELFRLAKKVERPKLIKGFKHILAREKL